MSNIFPIDFQEKTTMAQNDFILFSDSEDGNKIKKAQYKHLKGEKGDTGATGTAATISVGTTSSLPAGSSATVSNSGTSSAAVLNFGIPKGDKGDTGAPGATGNGIASITSSKSGDTTTITITETNGDTDTFTVQDGEDGDAQLFILSGTSDLTNAQAAYDWYLAGKYPVIKYGSKFYYLYSASSSILFWVIPYDKASDGSSTTGLYRDGIKMEISSGTITTITTTTIFVANSNYLRTGYNYPTPYTPEYDGSPSTKKYVDDGLSSKQDTLVSGTNIKTINNTSLLGSGDITISGGGSDIVYATQAEYTALLPGAESDGKHYFIYTRSGPTPPSPTSYTITGSTLFKTFTPSEGSDLQGCYISPDGTKMYLDFWSNKRLYQYFLSTPRDVSTATVVRYITVPTPNGITFSPNGVYMYHGCESPKAILRYTLSTPRDISTATQDQTYDVGGTFPYGASFSDDGLHMCYGWNDNRTDKSVSCDLGTAWDLTTVTNKKTTTQIGYVKMNGGGSYYYGAYASGLSQVEPATQYDISSTLTQVGLFDVTSISPDNRGLWISSDGKYRATGANNLSVYLYEAQPIS